MKERSIIFNGEMVRAILEGRKTQTHEVIKPQPGKDCKWQDSLMKKSGAWIDISTMNAGYYCPFGQPGDKLWVREGFAFEGYGSRTDSDKGPGWHQYMHIKYRADQSELKMDCTEADVNKYYMTIPFEDEPDNWKPSTHMPRWASRITLEITDVRVERVQDVSYEDAKKEGIEKLPFPGQR